MSFITDKQTLEDLGLLGKFKQHSVFSIFNTVKTSGGERLLDQMFHEPLSSADAINERSATFKYFQEAGVEFPFESSSFTLVENYLSSVAPGNLLLNMALTAKKKFAAAFLHGDQFRQLQLQQKTAVKALLTLRKLIQQIKHPVVNEARDILQNKKLNWLEEAADRDLSITNMARYDNILRNIMRREMEILLNTLYQLDVYIAVSTVARKRGFSYAEALPASQNIFQTSALRHPGLVKGVANPLYLHRSSNLLFLTGANMAGKSTLMKSFGIAVYMAHMGFPVAAAALRFSVRDGLYTSINVPDNLNMGYSHFYAEVLRVKKVAELVSRHNNLVVIFDELFKGTNVKDAYDATLTCTKAFSRYSNCLFVVSTHIIEVGEALKEFNCIRFSYLPTVMNGNIPEYTYKLTEGITSDRQGMIIIENEKILDELYSA